MAELDCFQNWLNLDHLTRSKFEGAPGGPPGQIRCSQWSQVKVLTGLGGFQAKNSKSVTHLFISVLKYQISTPLAGGPRSSSKLTRDRPGVDKVKPKVGFKSSYQTTRPYTVATTLLIIARFQLRSAAQQVHQLFCLSVCLWTKLNFSQFGQLMTTYFNL